MDKVLWLIRQILLLRNSAWSSKTIDTRKKLKFLHLSGSPGDRSLLFLVQVYLSWYIWLFWNYEFLMSFCGGSFYNILATWWNNGLWQSFNCHHSRDWWKYSHDSLLPNSPTVRFQTTFAFPGCTGETTNNWSIETVSAFPKEWNTKGFWVIFILHEFCLCTLATSGQKVDFSTRTFGLAFQVEDGNNFFRDLLLLFNKWNCYWTRTMTTHVERTNMAWILNTK